MDNSRVRDKVTRFSVGTVIKVVPYDQINPDILYKPEEYKIIERNGTFVTLEQLPPSRNKTQKRVVTKLSEIKIPMSEGICMTGYCPTFAYEYK